MTKSRTKNSAINATVATAVKILNLIMNFVCRTVFIKMLGTEYLGVNGLFTNILTILSFAELGIGNAIIFKLYKPIADEDNERIKTLIHFYKKAYYMIGSFILMAGLIVIPFLKVFINDAPDIKENLSYIYVLFLLNTSISYFFTHKRSIIVGHQKQYVVNIIELVTSLAKDVSQMIFLVITKNYVVYLILQILTTILQNIIVSVIANKMYPYINDKEYTKLSNEEQKSIFDDVKSLVIYKLGYVLSNGTDNMIISTFLGVAKVGLLSNYTIIVNSLTSLLSSAFNSLTAIIGNLNTIKEKGKKEEVFYQILLLSFVVYGYISIGLAVLINDFITIWLGKEYLLGISICIAIGFNLYIDGMRYVNFTFRNTLGLFKKGRFMPLISSITNVVLSIALVNSLGIFGVLIATGLTRLLILTWYDPYLIHKNEFETSSKRYYKTYLYYLVIESITFIICYYIVSMISMIGIIGFIVKGIILTVIVTIIFIIATMKLKEFRGLIERLKFLKSKK